MMRKVPPLLEPTDLIRWLSYNREYQSFYKTIRSSYIFPLDSREEFLEKVGRIRKKEYLEVVRMTREKWPILKFPFPPEVGKKYPESCLQCLVRPAEPVNNPLHLKGYDKLGKKGYGVPAQNPFYAPNPVFDIDLIGGRYLVIQVDLAEPWRKGLDSAIANVVRPIQKDFFRRGGMKKRTLPTEFWTVVSKALEIKSVDAYKIASALHPELFEKMTRVARSKKKAIRERVRKHLLRAEKLGINF
jgi:hypothetical protein